jgi:hypothetical protein
MKLPITIRVTVSAIPFLSEHILYATIITLWTFTESNDDQLRPSVELQAYIIPALAVSRCAFHTPKSLHLPRNLGTEVLADFRSCMSDNDMVLSYTPCIFFRV